MKIVLMHSNKEKICYLIGFSILVDRRMKTKVGGRDKQILRSCSRAEKAMQPIVIGALGTVAKSLEERVRHQK